MFNSRIRSNSIANSPLCDEFLNDSQEKPWIINPNIKTKTYYITKDFNNKLPEEFCNSLNRKYITFQYCRATCNNYLDGETELHASFIQRDNYCDSLVWYANLIPPDDNRKYEYIGTKRDFKIWFSDVNGNLITPDNFTVFMKLEY